jgi:putative tricarboxylic transport membrane protein
MKGFIFTLSLALVGAGLFAQANPAKSAWNARRVDLLVPASAGGGTDVVARAYTMQVTKDSGKALVVVNNPDGGGVVAYETVRNAPKDGGKLCFFHTSMLIASATGLYKKNILDDFTLIKAFESDVEGGYALVVRSDGPYKKLSDFVGAAKEKPGKVIIGIQTGGMTHLVGGTLARDAGVKFNLAEAGPDTEKLTSSIWPRPARIPRS